MSTRPNQKKAPIGVTLKSMSHLLRVKAKKVGGKKEKRRLVAKRQGKPKSLQQSLMMKPPRQHEPKSLAKEPIFNLFSIKKEKERLLKATPQKAQKTTTT